MSAITFIRQSKLRRQPIGKVGYVQLSPKSLAQAFGAASDESWDSESLGGYYFTSADDRMYTVYYRAYDQSEAAIKRLRRTFWEEQSVFEFSIGALSPDGVPEFRAWLQAAVKK